GEYGDESGVLVLAVVVDLLQPVVVPAVFWIVMDKLILVGDGGVAVSFHPTDLDKIGSIGTVFNLESLVVDFRCSMPFQEGLSARVIAVEVRPGNGERYGSKAEGDSIGVETLIIIQFKEIRPALKLYGGAIGTCIIWLVDKIVIHCQKG